MEREFIKEIGEGILADLVEPIKSDIKARLEDAYHGYLNNRVEYNIAAYSDARLTELEAIVSRERVRRA